ncbi:GSU2403 family nucleotidyltransferase fold protein [Sideroxydans sp.]
MRTMSNQQRLFHVESSQLLEAWRQARAAAMNFRGGMKWVKSGGYEYLIRLTDSKGNGKSLGKRSSDTEEIHRLFVEGRTAAIERYDALSARLKEQSKLNKAVGLGRLPRAVAIILSALDDRAAALDFRVVGTHALFAYEAMAGVFCTQELLASGDVDLLYDPRKKISLVISKLDGRGLLGLLQSVDKTFAPITSGGFRAVNNDGFMVDLITPVQDMRGERVSFANGDLVASEVPGLQWLCNAPAVQSTVIAESGVPLIINVPDPRAFAIHKAWLSNQPDRDPVKKPRDAAQAGMMLDMLRQYLPLFPLEQEHLRYFPKELIDNFADVADVSDIELPALRM